MTFSPSRARYGLLNFSGKIFGIFSRTSASERGLVWGVYSMRFRMSSGVGRWREEASGRSTEGGEMTWAMPPMDREQLVLFTTSLDEVIPEDHLVRVVDEI